MAKQKKLTWDDVFKDFKLNYPKQAKMVAGYVPHFYATILLIFPEGVRKTYNYDTKELKDYQ